ncbi:unnamed protein product, partial [Polarella glacialis]
VGVLGGLGAFWPPGRQESFRYGPLPAAEDQGMQPASGPVGSMYRGSSFTQPGSMSLTPGGYGGSVNMPPGSCAGSINLPPGGFGVPPPRLNSFIQPSHGSFAQAPSSHSFAQQGSFHDLSHQQQFPQQGSFHDLSHQQQQQQQFPQQGSFHNLSHQQQQQKQFPQQGSFHDPSAGLHAQARLEAMHAAAVNASMMERTGSFHVPIPSVPPLSTSTLQHSVSWSLPAQENPAMIPQGQGSPRLHAMVQGTASGAAGTVFTPEEWASASQLFQPGSVYSAEQWAAASRGQLQ